MKNNTTIKNEDKMNECIAECPKGMQPMFLYTGKFPKFIMYSRGSAIAQDELPSRNGCPSSIR